MRDFWTGSLLVQVVPNNNTIVGIEDLSASRGARDGASPLEEWPQLVLATWLILRDPFKQVRIQILVNVFTLVGQTTSVARKGLRDVVRLYFEWHLRAR